MPKIAIVTVEFYVEDQADFQEKSDKIMEYADEVMDCKHCDCNWDIDSDEECAEDCGNVCNLMGGSARLMTEEEFEKEFLDD